MTEELKIQPVEQLGAVGKCMASPQSYLDYMKARESYRYSDPTPAQVAAYALQQLESARKKDVEAHERNLPALAINQQIRDRVEALMTSIGMPRQWSRRDTNSRARFPKTITEPAGYIADLSRECRTSDNFDHVTAAYERMLRDYKAFEERAQRETEQQRAAAERAKEAEIERRKADMELASILLRYELPIESAWSDVLEALRVRHQRLDLAVAMELTRGDWSEGPWRVSDAMSRFQIETTEDKDISLDVLSGLEDFCDGRVFRDMRWSYTALYASIPDQQLVTDTRTALLRCGS